MQFDVSSLYAVGDECPNGGEILRKPDRCEDSGEGRERGDVIEFESGIDVRDVTHAADKTDGDIDIDRSDEVAFAILSMLGTKPLRQRLVNARSRCRIDSRGANGSRILP